MPRSLNPGRLRFGDSRMSTVPVTTATFDADPELLARSWWTSWADWCGPCKQIAPGPRADPRRACVCTIRPAGQSRTARPRPRAYASRHPDQDACSRTARLASMKSRHAPSEDPPGWPRPSSSRYHPPRLPAHPPHVRVVSSARSLELERHDLAGESRPPQSHLLRRPLEPIEASSRASAILSSAWR